MPSAPQTLTTQIVYDYEYDVQGSPLVGIPVRVTLSLSGATVASSPTANLDITTLVTTTDSNGYWQFSLVPNALQTPTGTTYVVDTLYKKYFISVPTGPGPYQSSQIATSAGSAQPIGDSMLTESLTVQGTLTGPDGSIWTTDGVFFKGRPVFDVRAFGAKGDNVQDDAPAFRLALAAATPHMGIVFVPYPSVAYRFNSIVDLSPYNRVRMVGGGGKGATSTQFASNQALIQAASGVTSVFSIPTNPVGSNNLIFENLCFSGGTTSVLLNGIALLEFVNCSFAPANTGGSNNCGLLLIDSFWVWFKKCVFQGAATTKPVILLQGTNAGGGLTNYLMRWVDCIFNYSGILITQSATSGPNAGTFYFETCDTENFNATPLLDCQTVGGATLAVDGTIFNGCSTYDSPGACPLMRVGTGAKAYGVTLIGCNVSTASDAITSNGGAVAGVTLLSNRTANITNPGTWLQGSAQMKDGGIDMIGQLGAGAGSPGTQSTRWIDQASPALRMGLSGDANAMFAIERNGELYWGPGGATTAWDSKFYRKNALNLGTDTTLSTGSGATGARPSAATAGVGARWYDTTLHKPIFSDGSAWRDAAGSVV